MTTIIAYTWEADSHCVYCTKQRFPPDGNELDENDVPLEAIDFEGNRIRPKFSSDEVLEALFCGTCCGDIAAPPDD